MTTKQKVIEIIADKVGFEPDEVKEESDLTEDLGLDSLDVIEIVMDLEKEFNISLDEKFHPVSTVAHVIEAVQSCLPKTFQNVHPETDRIY